MFKVRDRKGSQRLDTAKTEEISGLVMSFIKDSITITNQELWGKNEKRELRED